MYLVEELNINQTNTSD